ncbi:MAG: ComEC/Rec2 family competence protein [Bacteroidales bacterium]|jgi:ComEC/Rec2-related protein|nr:ComEC/Rec2 family competence protein [Bacteroidales bacterium]
MAAYLSDLPQSAGLALLIASSCLLTVSLAINTIKANILFGIAASLSLISLGFLLLRIELMMPDVLEEREAMFLCRVKSFPERKPSSHAIMVRLCAEIDQTGNHRELRGGLLIYHSSPDSVMPPVMPGDLLIITATPQEFRNRGNPFEFDYRLFMLKKGVRYYAFTNPHSLLSHVPAPRRNLREAALVTGKRISLLYPSLGMHDSGSALLSALTLGQKEMIDDDTRESFSKAGVMHVMAVSGLHAGIISMFIFAVLFFLRGKLLIVRVGISVLFLWGFAFVTGLSPSVVRASLMFTFLHTGKLLQRPVNNINTILASAFLMLILKPSDLTSLSFQLSFSAVLFISGFYGKAVSLFSSGFWSVDRLWQLIVVSLLAQLGTMPFTLNAFGRFPLWFLPANIVIIPLASLLIVGALLLIIISPFNGPAVVLAGLLNRLADLAAASASFIASLPGNEGQNLVLPWPETIALLLLVWAALRVLLVTREKRLLIPATALLLLTTVAGGRYHMISLTSELVVYNEYDGFSVGFREGHSLLLVTACGEESQAALRHAGALDLTITYQSPVSLPVRTDFSGRSIIIADKPDLEMVTVYSPDILITEELPHDFAFPDGMTTRVIIVTSRKPDVSMTNEILYDKYQTAVHYIQSDGALVLKFPKAVAKRGNKVDNSGRKALI